GGRRQESIMAGLAFGCGLQDELRHARLQSRGCLVNRNLGHRFFEHRAHGLDEFDAVCRHDKPSDVTAASLPLRRSATRNKGAIRFTLQGRHCAPAAVAVPMVKPSALLWRGDRASTIILIRGAIDSEVSTMRPFVVRVALILSLFCTGLAAQEI